MPSSQMSTTHGNRLLSRRELLQHQRNKQELGFEFPLTATYLGISEEDQPKVRLRRISLSDAATIDQIPSHLQDAVNDGIAEVNRIQRQMRDEGVNTDTLRDRISNNEKILPAADAFCLATFIEPVLVEHEHLVPSDDDSVWWVGDIGKEDRLDIFYANLNADSPAAKKLRIFRPKSTIDVQGRPAGDAQPQGSARDHAVLEVVGRPSDGLYGGDAPGL